MSCIALSPRTWNHRKYISYFITVSYINATDTKGRRVCRSSIKKTYNDADTKELHK